MPLAHVARSLALVGIGLLATGLVAAEEPEAPRELPQPTVDEAVRRGVDWLRDEQKRDGSFGTHPGETAICLLALRHSHVPADDKACSRAAARLERELPDGTVYGAALGIVALLAQESRLHDAKVRELAEDLVAAQCENGQWSYGYRRGDRKPAGDNSNTQFAVLALAAARGRGVKVPTATFVATREYFERTQNDDGGFGYSELERSRSYSSMTAGGLMCLALCRLAEEDLDPQAPELLDSPAIRKARGWLAENFDPAKNVGAARAFGSRRKRRSDDFWRHYHLWSIERACSVLGLTLLGEIPWYPTGGWFLIERQHDDGRWNGPERDLVATCFALLFFSRSTERVVTPRDRGPVTPSER